MTRPPAHFPLAEPDLGPAIASLLRLAGVRAAADGVWVGEDELTARFGHWRVVTPLVNVADAEVTGPYAWWKVAGPRLSFADRGLTFGTTARAGVCRRFRDPVAGIEPTGVLRHPGLTVTVAEPDLLVEHLRTRIGP